MRSVVEFDGMDGEARLAHSRRQKTAANMAQDEVSFVFIILWDRNGNEGRRETRRPDRRENSSRLGGIKLAVDLALGKPQIRWALSSKPVRRRSTARGIASAQHAKEEALDFSAGTDFAGLGRDPHEAVRTDQPAQVA